jgi:hypothetical protein
MAATFEAEKGLALSYAGHWSGDFIRHGFSFFLLVVKD